MYRKIIPDLVKCERPVRDGKVSEMPPEGTALEAAHAMAEHHVAAVAVIDGGGHLIGIVTERDLTRRVMAADLDPTTTTLAQIMTEDPDTLSPDDTAADALEQMKTNHYRHMPVVDGDGRAVAMVSIRHLYKAIQKDLEDDVRECRAFVYDTGYGTGH